jgi:hypothetical protein
VSVGCLSGHDFASDVHFHLDPSRAAVLRTLRNFSLGFG